MKSWNCPLGDPPAITCWINFPLSRTFVRNAHSRARGTEDRGRVGRKRIAAGAIIPSTINSDLHFYFYNTSILNIGILTSKARRRKMTMMDLTLVWTTSTTTTWTSTKWRCIRHPCMTLRKDPLKGVFQLFFYRYSLNLRGSWTMVTSRSFSHYLSIESNGCQSKAIDHSKSLPLST